MAKIYKVSGYMIDTADQFKNVAGVREGLTACGDIPWQQLHIDGAELTVFDSELMSADPHVDLAQCEKYFRSKPSELTGREVKVGKPYRHFKGNIVKVIAVAENTEFIGDWAVIYEYMDKNNKPKIWFRPYSMFVSEVEHEKYPNTAQKWRFEEVE